MEGDLGSEAERATAVSGNTGRSNQLTRSNSDASSLTAGICKDFVIRSENAIPDECTTWTNEKHNLYLYHLEMSFVEQFFQSTSVLACCSRHNLRDINISRKWLMNVHNAPEQNGCWEKFNCAAGEPFYNSNSADSHASPESKQIYQSTHRDMYSHPSPTKKPELLKLIGAWKQEKGILSHGIQTHQQEFSSSNQSTGDLICFTGEGTGQNFLAEDNQSALKFESQAKRLKIAFGDGSHQDQITPSRECPAPDHSVINSSKCGEQLAPCESVSKI